MAFAISPRGHKLYLICGNLEDEFIAPDLQRCGFESYLNRWLRELGYERIVYFSMGENGGKYVLDERSAALAINVNRSAGKEQAGARPAPAANQGRRIIGPQRRGSAQPASPVPASPAAQETQRLTFRQPKIDEAQFRAEAESMMRRPEIKTAIVYSAFESFAQNQSEQMKNYADMFKSWSSYASFDGGQENSNICLFLANYIDKSSLPPFLEGLQNDTRQVFQDLFLNSDRQTLNPNVTLEIGLPYEDEISYLLELLRVVGHGCAKLRVPALEREKIIAVILSWSREQEQHAKGAGNLRNIERRLQEYMRSRARKGEGEQLPFGLTEAKTLFPSSGSCKTTHLSLLDGREAEPGESPSIANWRISPPEGTDLDSPPPRPFEELIAELDAMIGLKAVKTKVKNTVKMVNNQRRRELAGLPATPVSRHMVFTGNPGTGKTTVARMIAELYASLGVLRKGKCVEVERADLVGNHVGDTALKTKDVIVSALGGVLFIDEAYSLVGAGENDFGHEAIETLLKAMEDYRDDLIVIVAGYPQKMQDFIDSNSGLKSRFNNYIHFEDYTGEELLEIFRLYCRKGMYRLTPEAEAEAGMLFDRMTAVTDKTNFGNGREARNLYEKCVEQQASRLGLDLNATKEDLTLFTLEDIRGAAGLLSAEEKEERP